MSENDNTIDEETLEKYRRIEYPGDNYDYWWRECNNCKKITYYTSLYCLNKYETDFIVCLECYYNINYEE
jgi:hypothetical protein